MNVTALEEVLESAKCVFFDFDGPICRLFSAYPAAHVAGQLRTMLDSYAPGRLGTSERHSSDPLSILSAARDLFDDDVIQKVEGRLTEAEKEAAATATPTRYAHELITELHTLGRTLAVTSNNSPAAIQVHLKGRELSDYFSPHIHGRRPDGSHLKPDPDCLWRAVESTGTALEQCVMIGDTPADWKAAKSAGVAFIGYAPMSRKEQALKDARAPVMVRSLDAIRDALRGTATPL
ncbi:HAD family hydrolase [Streptomyces sp. CMB-StM0423]|uniref:HAD family hydrolase n=1 Tax=Streptomyces sp. CMB-StM0423 TaxID=2059884 RepID=UPI000C71273A|nr:HAD-IA family hydrolase [Streptomyces sp. CMB-StM0423]AUH42305.1 HAD family hydrolase [Streptomyces sp. CMB-StM0423]